MHDTNATINKISIYESVESVVDSELVLPGPGFVWMSPDSKSCILRMDDVGKMQCTCDKHW